MAVPAAPEPAVPVPAAPVAVAPVAVPEVACVARAYLSRVVAVAAGHAPEPVQDPSQFGYEWGVAHSCPLTSICK